MMRRAWTRFSMLAMAVAALPALALAGGWKEVASEGSRHFVLVDAASGGDAAVYREAASAVCANGKPCLVLYWTDESRVAGKMPLSKAQSQAVVAQLRRNPTTGQDELLTRCRDNESVGRCLKD